MKNTWIVLSIIALISISIMTVMTTYLVRKGLPPAFVLLIVVIIIGLVSIAQLVLTHSMPKSVPTTFWILMLIAGILSAIGNLAIYRANAISPNPGLAMTILGLQGGIVALIAVFVLKDNLNTLQIVGVLMGIIAVVIISLGSQTKKSDSLVLSPSPNETNQETN